MSKNLGGYQGAHPNYQQDHEYRGLVHAAATATETKNFYRADRACRLVKVDVIPDTAVTGQATDYTTLQVAVNGTVKGSALAFSSSGVTMSAPTAGAVAATGLFGPDAAGKDAPIQLLAGDVVQIVFTKTGNGLAIPDGTVQVTIDGEP